MQCLVPDRSSIDWGEGNGSGTVGRGGFHTIDSLAGAGRGNYVRTGTALALGTPTVCKHSSPLAAATAATSTKEEEQEEPAHTRARARSKEAQSLLASQQHLSSRTEQRATAHTPYRQGRAWTTLTLPPNHQHAPNKHDGRQTTDNKRRTTHAAPTPRKRKPPPAPKDLSLSLSHLMFPYHSWHGR
eukprot:COSAG02_NODE_14682_length_1248_cov_1.624891_2_plen_186_part_00